MTSSSPAAIGAYERTFRPLRWIQDFWSGLIVLIVKPSNQPLSSTRAGWSSARFAVIMNWTS